MKSIARPQVCRCSPHQIWIMSDCLSLIFRHRLKTRLCETLDASCHSAVAFKSQINHHNPGSNQLVSVEWWIEWLKCSVLDQNNVSTSGPLLSGVSQEAGRYECWATSPGGQSHPADKEASRQRQREDPRPYHQCCIWGPEEAGQTQFAHAQYIQDMYKHTQCTQTQKMCFSVTLHFIIHRGQFATFKVIYLQYNDKTNTISSKNRWNNQNNQECKS